MKALAWIARAVDAEEADERRISGSTDAPERRRQPYVALHRYRRDMRALICVILVLGITSTVAAWTSYRQGERAATDRVERIADRTIERHESSFDTCMAGVDLRLSIAEGLEGLRRAAIEGPNPITGQARDAFLKVTQQPVDDLLSQAAGREFHAPFPPGSVSVEVVRDVTRLARIRCGDRADREWPLPKKPDR